MELTSVIRVTPPPPPTKVESVTITFTREEAIDLAHLVSNIGGSPTDFPQRSTYTRLFDFLFSLKLAGSANIGESPLTFAEHCEGATNLFLKKVKRSTKR